MSEIIAKLGLNSARFEQGLDQASRGWEAFGQKLRSKPVEFIPEKSARDSAKVFEDIARAREEHIGNTNRAALEQGLASGAGAVGGGGKSAADSARVFEEMAAAQTRQNHENIQAAEDLYKTKQRIAFEEANTVGRIRLVQRDLVTLGKQRNTQQEGTVARMRTEQQIEERLAQLRRLQRTQQAGNLVGLPSLQETEQRATGILGLLKKKFGAADLFKDSLRSLGVGLGVGAIANGIAGYFSTAADKAKELAAHTADLYQGTLRLLGVIGGPTRELELQARQVKEINRDIEEQRKLIADLNGNPLTFMTEEGRGMLREAETDLNGLIRKQADLATQIQITTIEENRRTAALQRQQVTANNLANIELRHGVELQKFDERKRALQEEYNILKKQGALPSTLQGNLNQQKALEKEREIFVRNQGEKMEDLKREARLNDEVTKAELRDASEVEKKQIRLNALKREEAVIKKRTGIASPELEANRNAQRALQNDIKVDQKKARQELINTLSGLGGQMAGQAPSRRPVPRPRGRSEMERIADRGTQFQINAEEGIRTGKTPDYIARMASAARRDLEAVGGKVGQATSKVAPQDAKALNSELIKANTTLKSIEGALKPVATK